MFYQWGRKDPFTFATSSLSLGKYPVKIYTIDGVLIYQESNGSSNTDKQPAGGVIVSSTMATSMMETIKNPISFHGGGNGELITQVGHTKALWDYYWASYSRGTDGASHPNRPNWHNDYLDGYVSNRLKSIYDPCPVGFRIPTNGTYNQFTLNLGWIFASYVCGVKYTFENISTWIHGLGSKGGSFNYTGQFSWIVCSTSSANTARYTFQIGYEKVLNNNRHNENRVNGYSVRCIEESGYKSAPTDGRDASGNIVASNKVALTSKQNSDAKGFFYQWGRKDPFTFATSSETWENVSGDPYGKYPVKIYTIDGVLIYQNNIGDSNKDKQPAGGIIIPLMNATSMMETIKNPIVFYGCGNGELINQIGHTKALWNYYWTSYSRGNDGAGSWGVGDAYKLTAHNAYLDDYKLQRLKSIYDPCPYGFRVPSNGTYNQFMLKPWTVGCYIGGLKININIESWFAVLGWKSWVSGRFDAVGWYSGYASSTPFSNSYSYVSDIRQSIIYIRFGWMHNGGKSVRCIEDLG